MNADGKIKAVKTFINFLSSLHLHPSSFILMTSFFLHPSNLLPSSVCRRNGVFLSVYEGARRAGVELAVAAIL